LLMVTNQVDMMCAVVRKVAPILKVIGMSGGVDSSRLRQVIQEELHVSASGFMIGFHNGSMTPLIKSIRSQGKAVFPTLAGENDHADEKTLEELEHLEKEEFAKITERVRTLGKGISDLQRTGAPSAVDTGASVLPSVAISKFVSAFCFNKPDTQSYNVRIDDKAVADHYGVPVNTDLSIPIRVSSSHGIEFDTTFCLLPCEKEAMRIAQAAMTEDIRLLYDAIPALAR